MRSGFSLDGLHVYIFGISFSIFSAILGIFWLCGRGGGLQKPELGDQIPSLLSHSLSLTQILKLHSPYLKKEQKDKTATIELSSFAT